jgi:hypothetical protein
VLSDLLSEAGAGTDEMAEGATLMHSLQFKKFSQHRERAEISANSDR